MAGRFFARIKKLAVFAALVLIVAASFWISFQLGKRILVPVRELPEPRIEVAIPEAPPSIKGLQETEKISLPEVVRKEEKAKVEEKAPLAIKLPVHKVAASRPAGKHYYKVQAGLYVDKGKAEELAEQVEAQGFEIYLKKVSDGWRVQVGAFRSKDEAEALQEALNEKGLKSQIVYE